MKRHILFSSLILTLFILCFSSCELPCSHEESEWINYRYATYYDTGIKHIECVKCGEILQSETIPKKICYHEQKRWVIDIEATTLSDGSRHEQCLSCKKNYPSEIIPRLELSKEEITVLLSESIFKVYSYDYDGKTVIGQGTGFFIGSNGTFITNAHVVDGTYYLKIQLSSGATYDVDKIYKFNDTTSDYAICHANISKTKGVSFSADVQQGDKVYSLSYPDDSAYLKVNSGEILSSAYSLSGVTYYENNAYIDHGSSGGILANAHGEVIGITSCQFKNSNYGAIRYTDFKTYISSSYTKGIEPLKLFHTVKTVQLSSNNANQYFDIVVFPSENSYSMSVDYTVYVVLKEKYLYDKIVMSSPSLTFVVDIDTQFNCYYRNGYSFNSFTKYASDKSHLFMYDHSGFLAQDRVLCPLNRPGDYIKSYYYTSYTYSTSFSHASGTITFYD